MFKNSNFAIISTPLLLIICPMLALYPVVAAFLAFFVAPIFILWMTVSILQSKGTKISNLPDNGDLKYLDLP